MERFVIAVCADMTMDLLAIMMALRILGVRIRPIRVCFGAFFGASAAQIVRLIRCAAGQTALLWLPLAVGMMCISGVKTGVRMALRSGMTLLACLGFLGGMVLALQGATGSLAAAYALSGACAAAVFVAALRGAKASCGVRHVRVECVIAEKRLMFDAIADSGNSLRDYLTHRPVIVAGEEIVKRLGDEAPPMRLIFADTAGGRQMMRMTIPKKTQLFYDGRVVAVKAALAFSPGLDKNAPALVPASLLEREG